MPVQDSLVWSVRCLSRVLRPVGWSHTITALQVPQQPRRRPERSTAEDEQFRGAGFPEIARPFALENVILRLHQRPPRDAGETGELARAIGAETLSDVPWRRSDCVPNLTTEINVSDRWRLAGFLQDPIRELDAQAPSMKVFETLDRCHAQRTADTAPAEICCELASCLLAVRRICSARSIGQCTFRQPNRTEPNRTKPNQTKPERAPQREPDNRTLNP